MEPMTTEIVETPDEAMRFHVVVRFGEKVVVSAPAVTSAEAQDILLEITAGARVPRRPPLQS
jgi:hypothetical protein